MLDQAALDAKAEPDSVSRLKQALSAFGLFMLFPGFVIYHSAVGVIGLSPPLGGLYGGLSALIFGSAIVLAPLSRRIKSLQADVYSLFAIGYLVYVLVWTGVNYLTQHEDYVASATIQSLQAIILWGALYFVGRHFPVNSLLMRRLCSLFLVCVVLMLGVYVISTGSVTFQAHYFYGNEQLATHQGYARSVLIVASFLLAVCALVWQRLVIVVLTAFALFVLGARSEFFVFLPLCGALLVFLALRDYRYALLIVVLAIAGAIAVLLAQDVISKSRQFLVLDLSTSASWISRSRMNEVALAQIAGSPILGSFGGHILETGGTGSYAHNLLSAYVNYGLTGMVWYVALTGFALLGSMERLFRTRMQEPIWLFSFSINFACFLLLVAAKSVFWPIPALGWGLYARGRIMARKQRRLVGDLGSEKRNGTLLSETARSLT